MRESAQEILREVLSEQMEIELKDVPPTEEIRKMHIFSREFMEKMRGLVKQQEETEQADQNRVRKRFSVKKANRAGRRIVAACIAGLILISAGVFGYQRLLWMGSSSSSDTSTAGMAMVDEAADQVSIYLTAENVTDHSMTLCVINSTAEDFSYGTYYEIEQYNEELDSWDVLSPNEDVGFDDMAYIVEAGESSTIEVDWTDAYGNLPAGTYRIAKEVQSLEDEAFYTLTVEFAVE